MFISLNGQTLDLQAERSQLLVAAARIVEIDAQVAILQSEIVRITPRRAPPALPAAVPAKVDLPVQAHVKSAP